jgi:hypothetical protein
MAITAIYTTTNTDTLDPPAGDTTAAIQAFIDAAPNGAVIDLGGGEYLVEGTLKIQGRQGLTIRNGTIRALEKGPMWGFYNNKGVWMQTDRSDRAHWWFLDCDDITLEDLSVISCNTEGETVPGYARYDSTYEAEHGFKFNACRNFTVEACSASNVWGDGFYFGPGDFKYPDGHKEGVTGFTVTNCAVAWNGRQGMGITEARDCLFENNVIFNSKRAAFDLEPNTIASGIYRVTFRGNTTNSINMAFPMRGAGHMEDIAIEDHTVIACGFPQVYVETAGTATADTNRARFTIDGWNSPETGGSDRWLFELVEVIGVTIKNVTATLRASRKGRCVKTTRCGEYVTITGNHFINGKNITVAESLPGTVETVPGGQFYTA